MRTTTRRLLAAAAVLSLSAGLGACAADSSDTPSAEPGEAGTDQEDAGEEDAGEEDAEPIEVKIGYIAGPAPAAHMLLADARGYFADENVTVEAIPFTTGISLSQALTGGSVDVGVMGAVIANFPSRGQGKVFMLNNLEANIQQLWASADSGITSVGDLAGKQVATTSGTAAHILLNVALKDAGVDPAEVEVVNLDMPAVTNTFVTGGIDAAALWAPFDQQIEDLAPDAVQLATSGDYEEAAIASGWVANNEFYAEHPDVLERLASAWLRANEDITTDAEGALDDVCPVLEEYMAIEVCKHVYAQTENFSNDEWREMYEDGTAIGWVTRMEETFVEVGALESAVGAEEYFDTEPFLAAAGE